MSFRHYRVQGECPIRQTTFGKSINPFTTNEMKGRTDGAPMNSRATIPTNLLQDNRVSLQNCEPQMNLLENRAGRIGAAGRQRDAPLPHLTWNSDCSPETLRRNEHGLGLGFRL
jgi:hypothetical protein